MSITRKTIPYHYENCFTNLANTICMLTTLKHPFREIEFITKSILTFLNDMSNLTYSFEQDMWFILIRNCYLTIFYVWNNPYYISNELILEGCKIYLEYSLKLKKSQIGLALNDVKEFLKTVKAKKNKVLSKNLKHLISRYKHNEK